MTQNSKQTRDLEADLAICEAATPGPWECKYGQTAHHIRNLELKVSVALAARGTNAHFITEAREGWPYAIRRAMVAEAEVDRLRDEIRMLQKQLEQRGVKV